MSSPITSPQPTEDTRERVRLHITPFNPSLLSKILPASLEAQATNISFHTVQTYPERDFGYVELPSMEAQKLKKKLNGSTLKGTKMRVDDAKPENKRKSEETATGEDEGRKLRKLERRAKRKGRDEQGVIVGHELEEGRRVKRGWTNEEADGRKGGRKGKAAKAAQEGEQDVEGKKLRFKTSVPTTPVEPESRTKKSKGSKGGKKQVVVEEFTKRKKPAVSSSDRGAPGSGALSFEEGVGWVDDAGNVVDALPKALQQDAVNSGHESERRISAIESTEPPIESKQDVHNDDAMSVDGLEDIVLAPTVDAQAGETQDTTATKEIHPLEALFKRPAKAASPPPATSSRSSSKARKAPPGPINTSFSFFPSNDIEEGEEDAAGSMAPPQTPHTKRDMEWRSIRSAAPTPDTAAIGRRFSFGLGAGRSSDEDKDDEQDEEREMGQDTPMRGVEDDAKVVAGATQEADGNEGGNGRGEESAFRKWFYENRGDLNRSWKKRRRDEKKVLRQRENRRVGARVA